MTYQYNDQQEARLDALLNTSKDSHYRDILDYILHNALSLGLNQYYFKETGCCDISPSNNQEFIDWVIYQWLNSEETKIQDWFNNQFEKRAIDMDNFDRVTDVAQQDQEEVLSKQDMYGIVNQMLTGEVVEAGEVKYGMYNLNVYRDYFEEKFNCEKVMFDPEDIVQEEIKNNRNKISILEPKLHLSIGERAELKYYKEIDKYLNAFFDAPKKQAIPPKALFDIWDGDKDSYDKIIKALERVYLPFDKPFIISRINNKLNWINIDNRIQYLAAFIKTLMDKKWVADNYSAPDWKKILENTFEIEFNEKPFKPAQLNNIDDKYKEPFKSLITNI